MCYRFATKLIILLSFILLNGCGSHLIFTYSDPSYENYLEDQRQKTPWQSDNVELGLQKSIVDSVQLSKTATARVKEVIDGQTIIIESDEIVRYIGVESPKRGEKFFEESKDFNRLLVERKRVKLEFDIQGRDADGNLLAYVFAEGFLVNAEIIKQGYARFVPQTQNTKYQDLLAGLQSQAIGSRRGIWSINDR